MLKTNITFTRVAQLWNNSLLTGVFSDLKVPSTETFAAFENFDQRECERDMNPMIHKKANVKEDRLPSSLTPVKEGLQIGACCNCLLYHDVSPGS